MSTSLAARMPKTAPTLDLGKYERFNKETIMERQE